ncbi:hypothetical protein ACWGI1_17600 [Streptomyces sp. NPDC054835]
MPRLRLRLRGWPSKTLILTDTPRPDCPNCEGEGGHNHDYGDYETGEYAGTEWDLCRCWDERLRWTLLRLPKLPRRRQPYVDPWATHSDEPPF